MFKSTYEFIQLVPDNRIHGNAADRCVCPKDQYMIKYIYIHQYTWNLPSLGMVYFPPALEAVYTGLRIMHVEDVVRGANDLNYWNTFVSTCGIGPLCTEISITRADRRFLWLIHGPIHGLLCYKVYIWSINTWQYSSRYEYIHVHKIAGNIYFAFMNSNI